MSAIPSSTPIAGSGSAGGPAKVLHIINGEFYAGAERVQELLAQSLPRFGYRVSFACLMRGVFQEELKNGGYESVTVPMRSKFDAFGVARKIAGYARSHGCRLIHTHTPRGALVGGMAASLAGLPLVHHVHSPTARNTDSPWSDRMNAWIERAALIRARALIPVSNSLAEDLHRYGYPRRRIVPIPNGVALADEQVTPGGNDALTLGVVALFRPRKGVEVLLRAVARLAEEGNFVRIRAIGDFETPEYERQVLALCDQLGLADQVEWRGFREDVIGELRHVDALALPSLFGEGMPMVVLEAMAVGLPIIGSRVEGVPEVVRNGVEGILVEPADERALAEAIGKLSGDHAVLRAMGSAGRERQRQTYSDLAMAESLAQLYDRVLGQDHRQTESAALAAREAQ